MSSVSLSSHAACHTMRSNCPIQAQKQKNTTHRMCNSSLWFNKGDQLVWLTEESGMDQRSLEVGNLSCSHVSSFKRTAVKYSLACLGIHLTGVLWVSPRSSSGNSWWSGHRTSGWVPWWQGWQDCPQHLDPWLKTICLQWKTKKIWTALSGYLVIVLLIVFLLGSWHHRGKAFMLCKVWCC